MSLSSPLFALLAAIPVVATLLLGVQLEREYVGEVLRRPRALVVGLAGQLLLLPLLAAFFFFAFPVPPRVGAGFFVLAAVPGGAFSNMVTFAGRGRLPLSVVLTAGSTLAGVVTIPWWVSVGMSMAGGDAAVDLPTTRMVAGSFLILVAPLLIGAAAGAWRPALAERLRQPTRRAMLALLLAGAGLYLAQRGPAIVAEFSLLTLVGASLFHVVAVLAGWGAARGLGLDGRDSFTLGIEVGLQNLVVGLLVVELLDRGDLVPLVGSYALATSVMLLPWVWLLGQRAPRCA